MEGEQEGEGGVGGNEGNDDADDTNERDAPWSLVSFSSERRQRSPDLLLPYL